MTAGWIIRPAAILLGIALATSMLGMAGGGTPAPASLAWIDNVLDAARACADASVMQPARSWLSSHGVEVSIFPHWLHAAALLFLLFIALGEVTQPSSRVGRWALVLWSGVSALVAGTAVGALSLADPRMVWALLAGVTFWIAGRQSVQGHASLSALPATLLCGLFAMMAQGVVPVHFAAMPPGDDGVIKGTACALAAGALALLGLAVMGGRDLAQGARAWAADPAAKAGLSILAFIAGTAVLRLI
jgi:hypothetical protein